VKNVGSPTAATDAATKGYADSLAFNANAGVLPGQTGNAGSVLSTDGTTAHWLDLQPNLDVMTAKAIAFSLAL
jgi:hypothetical protein